MLTVVRRAQVLSQRELGSWKAYTEAMYKVMRGGDNDFKKSSVYSTSSQVCFVMHFDVPHVMMLFLRVEALL